MLSIEKTIDTRNGSQRDNNTLGSEGRGEIDGFICVPCETLALPGKVDTQNVEHALIYAQSNQSIQSIAAFSYRITFAIFVCVYVSPCVAIDSIIIDNYHHITHIHGSHQAKRVLFKWQLKCTKCFVTPCTQSVSYCFCIHKYSILYCIFQSCYLSLNICISDLFYSVCSLCVCMSVNQNTKKTLTQTL